LILVIDNYDSFVHNLARYFRLQGCETRVIRNDAISLDEIDRLSPEAIVISPGPCTPLEAGCSIEVIQRFAGQAPILGICLGHQAIVQAFGGRIVLANEPMHGRASLITHDGSSMFHSLPNPFTAGRYHSLVAEKTTMPECLRVSAKSEDFSIMAIEHEAFPIVGLQFHPESVLTTDGNRLIENFLRLAGIRPTATLPANYSDLSANQ
jgi:anthranilate synthase/aminodeoxychorismate synthase-like glutamine amidotransferase